MSGIDRFLISPDLLIRDAMEFINRNTQGIALVVDNERCLIGTVTDGDIRRAILSGTDLTLPVTTLLEQRAPTSHPSPLTVLVGTPEQEVVSLMNDYHLRHIPVVNEDGQVVDVVLLSEVIKDYELPLTAVVMAGGFGSRLRPLTEDFPKPMLPVGDRPLLEIIIEQLSKAGIQRVNLTTHYMGEMIAHHFGDGRDFGVDLHYVEEDQPLGTAGALGLLDPPDQPLIVINGDILTRVDFRAMLAFHEEHGADMTVAVRQHEFRVPYGVIEMEGVAIKDIKEKPMVRHSVNAGIYVLNPEVCALIPADQPYDMTDLISQLVIDNRLVVSFPVKEYWLDIGQSSDYEQAQEDLLSGKVQS